MTALEHAAGIARRQQGAITFAQARQAGLSPEQVEHLVARTLWRRAARGVFVVAGSPDTWRQRVMAAVLAAPGSVASHVTAAAIHGWWRPPPLPHIVVPATHSARTRVAKVHRSELAAGDRVTVDGLPCTSPTRTLLDVAGMLRRADLEAMVDDAFCADQSCVEAVRRSVERLGRRGRRGTRLLTEVVAVWTPGIEPGSPAEMRLLRKLVEWGYEPPQRQVQIRSANGAFLGRADLGWPPIKVGFEYDSDRHHNPRSWEREERRHDSLRAAGWTIVTVSKRDLLPSVDLPERIERARRRAAA